MPPWPSSGPPQGVHGFDRSVSLTVCGIPASRLAAAVSMRFMSADFCTIRAETSLSSFYIILMAASTMTYSVHPDTPSKVSVSWASSVHRGTYHSRYVCPAGGVGENQMELPASL